LAILAGGCYYVVPPDGVAAGAGFQPVYSPGVDLRPVYSPYISGTQIRMVTNAGEDVFFYGGRYYRHAGGCWWHSRAWNFGWARTMVVPDVFLAIPPSHPQYYVVRVHPRYTVLRPGSRVVPRQPPNPSAVKVRPATPTPPGGSRFIKVRPATPAPPKGSRGIKARPATPTPPRGSRVIKGQPATPAPPRASRGIKVRRATPTPPRGSRVIKVPPPGRGKPKKEVK
jgi:hypothetical protein